MSLASKRAAELGPEHKHFKVIEARDKGNDKVKCVYCSHEMVGGATRMRAHLLKHRGVGCTPCTGDIPEAVHAEMQQAEDEAQACKLKKQKAAAVDAATRSVASSAAASSSRQSTYKDAVKRADKSSCDAALSKWAYAAGVSFNALDSMYFKDFCKLVGNFGSSYVPPGREKLRGPLLDEACDSIQSQLQPFMEGFRRNGGIITCDGWDNINHMPLMNVMFVSHQGVMFHHAIDTSGEAKTGTYIAEHLAEAIEQIGEKHVVAVITDGASNCKLSGEILMERYKNIYWIHCLAHVCDLLLEDICKADWAAEVIKTARQVATFIHNHHHSLALYREHCKTELKRPAETRFASAALMLEQQLACKAELQGTVVDARWAAWADKQTYKADAAVVKEAVLSEQHWEAEEQLLKVLRPIVKVLRLGDSNQPAMGKVYPSMFKALEQIKALDFLSPSERARIHTRFNKRWEQLHSPLHAAGYVLDPEFLSHQQHPEEVMEGVLQVVERMLPNPHDQQLAMEQLTRFRAQEGIFARAVVREGAKTMPAHAWWSLYGGGYPELQRVAIRVLSQVISASASERNWSTYGFIHSKSRNRLQPARANKLVYVHSNLRLLDRTSGVSYEEQFPVWDFESEDEA